MKKILFAWIALSLVFFKAQSQTSESDAAVIHIIGAEFQKDPKLEIFFNNKRIGYLTKGL